MSKAFLKSGEISLSDHCNLNCVGCNHSSPHMARRFTPLDTLLTDLKAFSKHSHFSELRLAGGEPLMHPELPQILKAIRTVGVCDKITLITNGTLLHKAPDEVWEGIDQMWISLYPNIDYKWSIDDLQAKCKKFGVRLWYKHTPTFKHTFLNQKNSDEKSVKRIYRRCRMANDWQCNLVYEGRFYKCVTAPFIEERLRKIGIEVMNKNDDSVQVHGNPNLASDLKSYLSSPEPMKACAYCLGTCGKSFNHHQAGRDNKELKVEHSNVQKFISFRQSMIGEVMHFVGNNRVLHSLKWLLRYSPFAKLVKGAEHSQSK